MTRYRPILALVLLMACTSAHALRCGNRVVDEGDRDFQVRERCGEPFWTESWFGVDIIGRHSPLERHREIEWIDWYYNFGPNALMQRLRFRDGVLYAVESLGHGVRALGEKCRPNMNFIGLSSGELVARCGTPSSRRDARESTVFRPARGIEEWRERNVQEWVYDFGNNQLQRILLLVDGKVGQAEASPR